LKLFVFNRKPVNNVKRSDSERHTFSKFIYRTPLRLHHAFTDDTKTNSRNINFHSIGLPRARQ